MRKVASFGIFRKYLFLFLFFLLLLPLTVNADRICVDPAYWTGSRSIGNGITASGGWDGIEDHGFQINWEISYDSNSKKYTYTYTFSGKSGTVLSKDLSHWILEVTNPSDASDFTINTLEYPAFSEGPAEFTSNQGNPGMQGNIYGIKWETNQLTFSFDTAKRPVWGDFYAKDGKDCKECKDCEWTYAYNTGFGNEPTLGGDFTNWIPTPDGDCVVPVPSTLLLLGSGLLGFGLLSRRR